MRGLIRPIVFVGGPPTFVEIHDRREAAVVADAFAAQWRYIHGTATADDLAPYRDIRIDGRAVETDPDALDEWGRRGEFDLAEVYRELFS